MDGVASLTEKAAGMTEVLEQYNAAVRLRGLAIAAADSKGESLVLKEELLRNYGLSEERQTR